MGIEREDSKQSCELFARSRRDSADNKMPDVLLCQPVPRKISAECQAERFPMGVPNDNNPNLVVPIGDGFGFVIYLK